MYSVFALINLTPVSHPPNIPRTQTPAMQNPENPFIFGARKMSKKVFVEGSDGGNIAVPVDKPEKEEVVGLWEGLNPEILALIFVRIPAEMMVRSVPMVCRPWMETVAGPYCWTEIDVEDWCRRCNDSHTVDSVVKKLVRRSKSTVKRLSVFRLGDSGFSFVANRARCLKVLEMPMSEVTDLMVLKHGDSLANLTELDISYCLKITSKGIETFGKLCKSLLRLKRNMPPPEVSLVKVDNSEAMVIADTMSGLHSLELGFGCFDDSGLDAILCKCEKLVRLDIRGCWKVELKGDLEERCEKLKHFHNRWIDSDNEIDEYFDDGSSHDSDEASSTDTE